MQCHAMSCNDAMVRCHAIPPYHQEVPWVAMWTHSNKIGSSRVILGKWRKWKECVTESTICILSKENRTTMTAGKEISSTIILTPSIERQFILFRQCPRNDNDPAPRLPLFAQEATKWQFRPLKLFAEQRVNKTSTSFGHG